MPTAILTGPWDEVIALLDATADKLEAGFGGDNGPLDKVGNRFRQEMTKQFDSRGEHLTGQRWADVGTLGPDPPAEYRRQHQQVPAQEVDSPHYTQESSFDPVTDPLHWTADLLWSLGHEGAPGNISEVGPFEAIFGSSIPYAGVAEFGGPGDWWERQPRPIITGEGGADLSGKSPILPKLEEALVEEFSDALKSFLPLFEGT